MEELTLRDVREEDFEAFFEHQLDPVARHMAAFAAEDPADRDKFMERWRRILANDKVVKKTILCDGLVAGHIVSFTQLGETGVGYWLGKQYWGQGLATRALAEFLEYVPTRPLYARVVKDNVASRRVLEKCGFKIHGEDRGFAHGRGEEVEEYVLRLDAPARTIS